MFGDGGAVRGEMAQETGFGNVDQVVVRPVFEHGRVPAVVAGFDGLGVDTQLCELGNDDAGGSRLLLLFVGGARELFFFGFIFTVGPIILEFFDCA